MSNPSVTWLLPVRNGMPYLPLALASIAAQTYRNFEIIAWDNGSTDGTLETLRDWIPHRIPGRVVQDRPMKLGPSMAALVETAQTELCAVMHGDDVNLPVRLERQVDFLNAHPEVGIVGSNVRIIDDNGQESLDYIFATGDAEIRWLNLWKNQLCHPSVMFRRSVVLAAGNYQDWYAEDANLWIRAAKRTEIRNIDEILLYYRRSDRSQTGRVVDWEPNCRQAAESCAEILFPGITDRAEAMELWQLTYPAHWNEPIQLRHWLQFRRTARLMARDVGKPENYFTATPFFQEQEYHLRRRILEKFGLAAVMRFRAALKSLAA